jgi:hypothetical protein
MDLNVKLHGLKYNFRKVHGCFSKILGIGYFLVLLNYFSIKNSVNRVYNTVDRVHGRGSPRSTGFIKPRPLVLGSAAGI